MPGSVVRSGGAGGSVSSGTIAEGINTASDIDLILAKLDTMGSTLLLIAGRSSSIPQMHPTLEGLNQSLQTPIIAAPGPGRCLIVQLMGWYSGTPQNGLIEIIGSNNLVYLKTPIIAAKAGLVLKTRMPENTGCSIAMSAGGAGISAYLNYASTTELTTQ